MASILLVEDSPDIRSMVELLMQAAGHTVVSVGDGLSAVQQAANDRPDLIVMDLALPQLDGWEATRQLKANPLTRAIPVLAFSAHVLPDDIDRALAAGCAAVIPKPFDIDTFLTQITAILAQSAQPGRQRAVGSAGEE
jgi:two-component system cell cycle response regulator DivK